MEHERIIFIYNLLLKTGNDKKGITIKDIQSKLSEHTELGTVTVLTVRRDIERLIAMGYDIKVRNGAHNTAYYSMNTNSFTFNEIRFILDSISINKFISYNQKRKIFEKFKYLCSESEASQLISRVSISTNTSAPKNLLENLEKVHIIISENKKINFEYGKLNTREKVTYYDKKRNMIPCKVVYFNERFYLKCINEETQEPRTYRIDRMKNIRAGEKPKIKAKLPAYQGAVVDIFEPDFFETVTFRINKVLLDDMYEQFGSHMKILNGNTEKDTIMIKANVSISQGFYKWVMRYGDYIEITAPEKIRKNFSEQIKKVYNMYNNIT